VIDYQNFKLTHQHGDQWLPMVPDRPVDPAGEDPERALLRHGVSYRCIQCDQGVTLVPTEDGHAEPRQG